MVIKTFNLDEEVYRQFADFCKAHGLSMSNQINVFIKSQMETEPKVRGEYLQRLDSIRKGRFIKVGIIGNFKKRYA